MNQNTHDHVPSQELRKQAVVLIGGAAASLSKKEVKTNIEAALTKLAATQNGDGAVCLST